MKRQKNGKSKRTGTPLETERLKVVPVPPEAERPKVAANLAEKAGGAPPGGGAPRGAAPGGAIGGAPHRRPVGAKRRRNKFLRPTSGAPSREA